MLVTQKRLTINKNIAQGSAFLKQGGIKK